VGALRAVTAIFRATAGLDAEQARRLDMIGVEVSAVNALRAENQIRERLIVQRFGFGARPVVAWLCR